MHGKNQSEACTELIQNRAFFGLYNNLFLKFCLFFHRAAEGCQLMW